MKIERSWPALGSAGVVLGLIGFGLLVEKRRRYWFTADEEGKRRLISKRIRFPNEPDEYWVTIPQLSCSADTTVYMWRRYPEGLSNTNAV